MENISVLRLGSEPRAFDLPASPKDRCPAHPLYNIKPTHNTRQITQFLLN